MPPLSFLVFEWSIYLIGLVVVIVALRRDRFLGLVVLSAMVFGFVIEFFDIRTFHSYFYNEFSIMLGPSPNWVPLAIAVAWGCIVFTTTQTSDSLALPSWQRPSVDALLAVFLDFALDPVASTSRVSEIGALCDGDQYPPGSAEGIGFWVWCVPEEEEALFFGVPLGNFFGWMAVVGAFSLAYRLVVRWLVPPGSELSRQLFGAMVTSVLALVIAIPMLFLYVRLATVGVSEWVMFGIALAIPLFWLARAMLRQSLARPPGAVLLMPGFTYAFSLSAFFLAGVYARTGNDLLVTLIVVTVLGLTFYTWSFVRQGTGAGEGAD
jgi:uncharacterized membrane protein